MKKIYSPWIHQLNKDIEFPKVPHDLDVENVVVGGGIAGISTSFFLLKYTEKKVTLIEGYKIAHGATGHNAGQVASYFERPLFDIAEEFGLELTAQGQKSIEDAWTLIDEMYNDAGLSIPFSRFQGHLGLSTKDQLCEHLKNNAFRKEAGIHTEEIFISEDAPFVHEIPSEYAELYALCSAKEVIDRLETESTEFHATVSYPKGTVNSALFCQKVLDHMLTKYQERFTVYEHTPIQKIVLHADHALLDAGEFTITTQKVILCTNGFKNLTILNTSGLDIDLKFHHTVKGTVGYMSGYLEKYNKPPAAISYFGSSEVAPIPGEGDPYFYLTRRTYEYEQGVEHNLICVGGPDLSLDDQERYLRESDYPHEAEDKIDQFINTVYDRSPNKNIDLQFTWHGLMGYTPNRIRLIGQEPKNSCLLYNLGCNGVGILPSVFGGRRIARILAGETIEKSIFDPRS